MMLRYNRIKKQKEEQAKEVVAKTPTRTKGGRTANGKVSTTNK